MAEQLLSVGLDVGTTTVQLIVSRLQIENRASAFSVPDMEIAGREILYRSPIHFTPLLHGDLVDGAGIREIVEKEYEKAGIRRERVDTGAIIITGETSRKENAAAVLRELSDFAGDFVVATAGPDLESVLAAKGAGADSLSEKTGKTVLHMDIGGGTSNLAWLEDGKIMATGCLNVGGRLLKFGENGTISYVSPALDGIFAGKAGDRPARQDLEALAQNLTGALEMAAGLRPATALLIRLTTKGTRLPSRKADIISFSGGVADCIEEEKAAFAFGDLGPILGQAIRKSRLCSGPYRLGAETIRATVIGAGCHSAQLSGSTVFHQNIRFPLKNLPVVGEIAAVRTLDAPGVLALAGVSSPSYAQVQQLAAEIAENWPDQQVLVALEADCAKALGHALALRLGKDRPILCIDRVRLTAGSYLDVGQNVGPALPVVIKTLAFSK